MNTLLVIGIVLFFVGFIGLFGQRY